MEVIRDNAEYISTLMTEFTLLVNYMWRKIIHDESIEDVDLYFDKLKTTTLNNIAYAIQGKNTSTPLPEAYAEQRQTYGLPVYTAWDNFNRHGIFQQEIVKFEQNIQDNIKRRMFLRIKRWGKQILELDAEDARAWTLAIFSGTPYGAPIMTKLI